MFKVNNKDTRTTPLAPLVSLLLTLNIFYTMFLCFYCYLWTCNCRLGSISMFDLSSLYTNIPHHQLKSVMGQLINFCFNGGDEEFIGTTRYCANSQQKHRLSFNKSSSKLAFNYLLDNSYFTLGSMCFRRLIGIPMGSDQHILWLKRFCIIAKGSGSDKKWDSYTAKGSNNFRYF